jgi:ribosome biogenesis protein BMS1
MVDRSVEEPPPFTVLVHGPPGVGKTTLIKGLIKHYTRQDVREVKGPITLIAGKARRYRRGSAGRGAMRWTAWLVFKVAA